MFKWELETDNGIYFWGGILSNWAKTPFLARVLPEGQDLRFNTSEQYMMRIKAQLFNDISTAKLIMETSNPKEQKRLGRAIVGYSDEKWNPVARDLSYIGVYQKFMQNSEIQKALLESGDKVLVEASPVDKKWGVGLEHLDPRILDKSKWLGTNWLGQILMKVRDDIRDGVTNEFKQIDWTPYE